MNSSNESKPDFIETQENTNTHENLRNKGDSLVTNPCSDCGCEIPQARLVSVEDAIRCAPCQEKYELENPESTARKAPEDPIGSRNDFNKMRGRQGFQNKTGKH